MDTTIIERWKLCTFASFIGCIILVLCLNQGHNSANLSALQNPAISVTSFNQFPTPSIPAISETSFNQFPTPSIPAISETSFNQFPTPSIPAITETSFNQFTTPSIPAISETSFNQFPTPSIPAISETSFNQFTTPSIPAMSETSFNQFPTPSIPAISETSYNQFPTPSVELSAASKLIAYRPKAVNHREDRCNIFDGQWVYNSKARPLYEELQCPFLSDQVSCRRNGRSDSDYEKWSWRANGCEIPRFNATDMLERLRGKRVIIVGDSLNRNQWESLACLLYSAVPPSQAEIETQSSVYKVFRAKDYKCSVEFYWSPFLVQLDVRKENGARVLRLDKLSGSARRWQGADIMVFNTGHWWAHQGKLKAWDLFQYEGKLVEEMEIESALDIGMKTWARWIRRKVDRNKTRVFFRSISPSHAEKQCYNETQPILDESLTASFPKPLTNIIEGTIKAMRNPVRYLNITNLSQYRRDAHPSIYARKPGKLSVKERQQRKEFHLDCSHWCLPGLPDTWNSLLYASLVFDTSGHISDS